MSPFKRHVTQAIVVALCAAGLLGCLSSEQRAAMRRRAVPTSHALVFNPVQFWMTSHCGTPPITDAVYLDLDREHPRFRVLEAMHRHVWLKFMSVHFDPNDYPIAVLTYRAERVLKKDYLLWLDDTSGPQSGAVVAFETEDLILDGQVHEVRKDLRELNPAGEITQAWFAVQADAAGDAYIDLIDLRFEADPAARLTELLPDEPIALRVVDESGKPIAGATVTADSEFLNLSRSARTDSDGRVTIAPLQTPAGTHMLRISADGYVTIEAHGESLPRDIALPFAATYGGRVVDEQGRPVANVAVHMGQWQNDRTRRMNLPIKALTDANGRWTSPPMPANLTKLELQFHHARYMADQRANLTDTDLNAAREQRYDFVLPRGSRVDGTVTNPDGQPVAGAKVRVGRRTAYTDANGAFTAWGIAPGETSVTVKQPGFAPSHVSVNVAQPTPSVAVRLDAGRTFHGRVVDADGHPLEGVMIKDSGRTFELRVFTDADGRFTWQGAPSQAEALYVDAWHETYGRARRQPINEDGDTVIVLESEQDAD